MIRERWFSFKKKKKEDSKNKAKKKPTFQKTQRNLEKSTFLIKAILCLAKEDDIDNKVALFIIYLPKAGRTLDDAKASSEPALPPHNNQGCVTRPTPCPLNVHKIAIRLDTPHFKNTAMCPCTCLLSCIFKFLSILFKSSFCTTGFSCCSYYTSRKLCKW